MVCGPGDGVLIVTVSVWSQPPRSERVVEKVIEKKESPPAVANLDLDKLIRTLEEIRSARADLDRREAEVVQQITERLRQQQERLRKLGVPAAERATPRDEPKKMEERRPPIPRRDEPKKDAPRDEPKR
jgi:mevalonate kinase